jgi:hypothetical protein
MNMRWSVTSFVSPKDGYSPHECEDAIAWNSRTGAFAVADGATEAYASREWARSLVRGWVRSAHLPVQRDAFLDLSTQLSQRAHQRWASKALTWYGEEKLRRGSFAAFVGVRIRRDGEWEGIGIGDCCAIQMREGEICYSAPLDSAASFSQRPILLSTLHRHLTAVERYVVEFGHRITAGDALYLASDALSSWMMRSVVDLPGAVQQFDELMAQGDRTAVDSLLLNERRASRLRNDDVAVLRISGT